MSTQHLRTRLTGLAVLTLTLLMPALALAHGKDGVHVMGMVKEMKQDTLVLETNDKMQQDVMTDPSTRYEKSGAAVTSADLKPGERVVVHGMKMSNGQVHAQLVKFGKPPAKAPAAPQGGTEGTKRGAAVPAQEESHEHAGH